jgi:ribosomal protein S18 acetylase RimI-like enzyme
MAVRLRPLEKGDVAPLERILNANAPVFNAVEVKTAVELLQNGVAVTPGPETYRFLVAEDEGRVLGYALYGRTPLTQGTWDLYWLATDPQAHGKGVGSKLLRGVEDTARTEGGRLVIVETSSRADYARARRFYERAGYKKSAVLEDFYKDGDDKIIYTRRVDAGP